MLMVLGIVLVDQRIVDLVVEILRYFRVLLMVDDDFEAAVFFHRSVDDFGGKIINVTEDYEQLIEQRTDDVENKDNRKRNNVQILLVDGVTSLRAGGSRFC